MHLNLLVFHEEEINWKGKIEKKKKRKNNQWNKDIMGETKNFSEENSLTWD